MIERRYRRAIQRILRVNHAGEYGAIRIYRAQMAAARFTAPALLPFLRETLGHEREHLAAFRELMWPRGASPCGAMPLWGLGGTALGLFTGLLGRDAILICTESVERTVRAHLNEQLEWLGTRDPVLSEAIARIDAQEQGHLHGARARQARRSAFGRALDRFVAAMTGLLIWCSTYGALTRMRNLTNLTNLTK
ncbi:MAG TPA: demethoxyubiquinone hydroxylase family protein [Rhizomicrobium sp.]